MAQRVTCLVRVVVHNFRFREILLSSHTGLVEAFGRGQQVLTAGTQVREGLEQLEPVAVDLAGAFTGGCLLEGRCRWRFRRHLNQDRGGSAGLLKARVGRRGAHQRTDDQRLAVDAGRRGVVLVRVRGRRMLGKIAVRVLRFV